MGTDGATDAADSSGFAEQLQGFKAADPIAVALPPHAPVASIKVAAGSEQATDTAESTDNSTGAAMLAALLFGVTGAAPTALPLELHLTGDSLPSVEATGGTGTPSGQQRLLAGILDAQGTAAQLEAAATQVQQPAAALLELVQSKAASETSSPVPLPAVPAEGGSETTDMAFAARLRPGPATASDLASSHRSGEAVPRITAIAEFRRAEADGGRNQNTGLQPAQQMANPAAQTFITADGSASPAATDKPPALAGAETRTIAPEATPVKSTEPLKELSLQMGSPNQERVEVRMVERGGELHVAVRTGSADLAHGLREGISDLVSRLQETGFRTDTWRPVHGAASVSAASGPQQSATEFRNHSDSQSNPGWSQQQTRDQREHQQSNRPSWVEELEGSLTPTAEPSPGEKHGLFR
jgi:hypothetical protein